MSDMYTPCWTNPKEQDNHRDGGVIVLEEWRKATCEECAWAMDTNTYYPLCRRFHIEFKCCNPACPAFVRR